tara:strand:+ start:680 stop:808 length:129 start_codon:yes stop_codon:yes gene_type:complete
MSASRLIGNVEDEKGEKEIKQVESSSAPQIGGIEILLEIEFS